MTDEAPAPPRTRVELTDGNRQVIVEASDPLSTVTAAVKELFDHPGPLTQPMAVAGFHADLPTADPDPMPPPADPLEPVVDHEFA